jgi:hypothetical protein
VDHEETERLKELTEELAPAPEEDEGETKLPEPATPQEIEAAEKLIQQAQLAKIRGQGQVAERLLKEATEVAPGAAAVHAALGDQLWERSQFSRARAEYKLAHLLEPNNVALETKWAESLVGSMGNPLANQAETYASAKSAMMLSAFFPGLGQIVSGELVKGIVMLVLWIGGWVVVIPAALSRLPTAVGRQGTHITEFGSLAMTAVVVLVITWAWSVLSANSKIKESRMMQVMGKVERPTPPGEGNFEL